MYPAADATQIFEETKHSVEAREMMQAFFVGIFVEVINHLCIIQSFCLPYECCIEDEVETCSFSLSGFLFSDHAKFGDFTWLFCIERPNTHAELLFCRSPGFPGHQIEGQLNWSKLCKPINK